MVAAFFRVAGRTAPASPARHRTVRALLLLAVLGEAGAGRAQEPFSFFLATPQSAVMRMLALAKVGPDDLVLDLGSGDGRIPITAARAFGARGWGVDLDPRLVAQSDENARRAGVADRVRFEVRDVLRTDTRAATVVTIYLLPELLDRLRDKLLRELKPGSRIVVHEFAFTGWAADRTEQFHSPDRFAKGGGDSIVRLWIVPADAHGRWRLTGIGSGEPDWQLEIFQNFQVVEGALTRGTQRVPLIEPRLRGDRLQFAAVLSAAGGRTTFSARVGAGAMSGTLQRESAEEPVAWRAQRAAVR